MGKSMVSLVNSHTNATRIGWHLWEIGCRFALNSTPGSLDGGEPFEEDVARVFGLRLSWG